MGTDFESLKDARDFAYKHEAETQHDTYVTNLGAFCHKCDWHYIALQTGPSLEEEVEKAAKAELAEALEFVKTFVGCGDNSCLFRKPTGMATNGGCRCFKDGMKPGMVPALAKLYKAAWKVVGEK